MKFMLPCVIAFCMASCDFKPPRSNEGIMDSLAKQDTISLLNTGLTDSILDKSDSVTASRSVDTVRSVQLEESNTIQVGSVKPDDVIRFAETLVGTPYVYGSTDPKVGFDCSGFITYVFNHFKIKVPRSSVEFTSVGKTVPVEEARRGDIILFTDPDFDNQNSSTVGHMGLITANNNGSLTFIHSTSGKAMSVAITSFSEHYKKRFVRVGRIFP